MRTEPRLEDLSAYLDQELTGSARQDLEAHLSGCETCRRRLDALRMSVEAVRGLPAETPPRTFSVPPARPRQPLLRWQPLAWTGTAAAAAAVLIVAVLVVPHGTQGGGGGGGTSRAAAPAPKSAFNGSTPGLGVAAPASNGTIVVDPAHPGRRLALRTDSAVYSTTGTLAVTATVEGIGANPGSLRLILVRSGYGVELPVALSVNAGTAAWNGTYKLAELNRPNPETGTYQLSATWSEPDSTGAVLVAQLPLTIR